MQQIAALRPAGSIIVEEAPSSRGPMHDHLPMLERDMLPHLRQRRSRPRPARIGGRRSGAARAQGHRACSAMARPCTRFRDYGPPPNSLCPSPSSSSTTPAISALEEFGHHFAIDMLPGMQLPHLDFCGLAAGARRAGSAAWSAAKISTRRWSTVFAAKVPMLLEVAWCANARSNEGAHRILAVPADAGAIEAG